MSSGTNFNKNGSNGVYAANTTIAISGFTNTPTKIARAIAALTTYNGDANKNPNAKSAAKPNTPKNTFENNSLRDHAFRKRTNI